MNWEVLILLQVSLLIPSMYLSRYSSFQPDVQWMAYEVPGKWQINIYIVTYLALLGFPSTAARPRRGRPH